MTRFAGPIILLLLTGCAGPSESVLGQPWQGPSYNTGSMMFYPPAALKDEVAGSAVIECDRVPQRRAEDCRILWERPSGRGFGEAATRMQGDIVVTPEFRTPKTEIYAVQFCYDDDSCFGERMTSETQRDRFAAQARSARR